ncbi:hypothetical protein T12_13380 [Trichinella patagoniensis]|uniref:Uncharacterized protein n=1 Tax=Trichinella patagoniensis TaxID=990121 RepID=A0A0V0Z4Z2_9BILA|nr:hypothetical protein T12_13380 [Trichinella patagoniensis]
MATDEVGPNRMERAQELTSTNRMGRQSRAADGDPQANPMRTTEVGRRRLKITAPNRSRRPPEAGPSLLFPLYTPHDKPPLTHC